MYGHIDGVAVQNASQERPAAFCPYFVSIRPSEYFVADQRDDLCVNVDMTLIEHRARLTMTLKCPGQAGGSRHVAHRMSAQRRSEPFVCSLREPAGSREQAIVNPHVQIYSKSGHCSSLRRHIIKPGAAAAVAPHRTGVGFMTN